VQPAFALVVRHPAVTSAIVGPRTMDHVESYPAADGVELPRELLDRIDEIERPGQTIDVADDMWATPALAASARRR
jgi:aryl-alcohol dehydrogenase-like predicted oxidoreductase